MAFPSASKHRCRTSEKSFNVQLGAGAAIKLLLHGRLNGTLDGQPISGYGSVEYTYIQGAAEWVRSDLDGTVTAPASLPVALGGVFATVYDPRGKCSGKVSIDVDGDSDVDTTSFNYRHKKDVWKMKGRTTKLTINVIQEVAGPCDFTGLDLSQAAICGNTAGDAGPTGDWDTCTSLGATGSCLEECKVAADMAWSDLGCT